MGRNGKEREGKGSQRKIRRGRESQRNERRGRETILPTYLNSVRKDGFMNFFNGLVLSLSLKACSIVANLALTNIKHSVIAGMFTASSTSSIKENYFIMKGIYIPSSMIFII